MLDAYTAELIREEYHKRLTIAEDFNAWLHEEGDKVSLDPDPDTVQKIVKDLLR